MKKATIYFFSLITISSHIQMNQTDSSNQSNMNNLEQSFLSNSERIIICSSVEFNKVRWYEGSIYTKLVIEDITSEKALTAFIFDMYDLHEKFQPKGGTYRVTTIIKKTSNFINPNPTSTHTSIL